MFSGGENTLCGQLYLLFVLEAPGNISMESKRELPSTNVLKGTGWGRSHPWDPSATMYFSVFPFFGDCLISSVPPLSDTTIQLIVTEHLPQTNRQAAGHRHDRFIRTAGIVT